MTSTKSNVTYYSMKDISAIATDIISSYISDGYIMNIGTMAGSQGDDLKADLVKNGKTIRIRIFEERGISFSSDRDVILETRLYDGVDFKSGHSPSTLWNDHGEVLTSRRFYAISGDRYRSSHTDTFYVDDEQAARRAEEIRDERTIVRAQIRDSKEMRMNPIPAEKALKIIKSRPGYKRAKLEDITYVYRRRGHYYAELNRLPSKNAEYVIKLA